MSPNSICCSNKWFHTTKTYYHQACPYPLLKPPWLVRNQWSMVNTFFIQWNEMDLYNQYLIPTIYSHTAQQVGLNSFPPNSAPSAIAFHRSNPTTLLWGASSGSSVFTSSVGLLSPWVVADLIWSRCSRKKRKAGRATGPQVGEKVNTQPMLENGGEGFCGSDTILLFFACKNRLVIAFLIRFKSLCAWIYQMSYSVLPANLWVQIWCSNKWFHNKTAQNHHHPACPYPLLNPLWLIRNQWSMVNTYF